MIVQIYAMVTVEDAIAVAKAGADHVGFLVDREGPTVVSASLGRKICRALPQKKRVMMPICEGAEEVISLARAVKPDMIHMSQERLEVKDLEEMRKALPGIEFMRSVSVDGGSAIERALEAERYFDYILLDSPGTPLRVKGFIGSAGKAHDWGISREIVEKAHKPVILAGGLNPENVGDAVKMVRPYGVDACTALDLNEEGRKDIEKVRLFVKKAREAAKEIEL
jgi:phosphoribosylanthranilate isomerase